MSARRFDPAEPEMMDRPQPVTAHFRDDLKNLRTFNRIFGAHRLVQRVSDDWIRRGEVVTVLDVATASGDIPRMLAERARHLGRQLQITAVDRQDSSIEIARELTPASDEIQFVVGDAMKWTPPMQFDLVLCNLALHHFSAGDAVALLARLSSWSRRYLLVSDLRRHLFLSLGVWLLTAFLFRNEMTRVDARLSAARAFSFREFAELARRAGWSHFQHRRFPLGRQALWREKEKEK